MLSRLRGACSLLLALLLVACGGGGSDGPTLTPTPFEATAVARESIGVQFQIGARNLPQGQTLYVLTSGGHGIFASLDLMGADGSGIAFQVATRDDLAQGVHRDTLSVQVCADPRCNRIVAGPVDVPLTLTATPNIEVAPAYVELERTGAEAPPVARIAVSIPPGASSSVFLDNDERGLFALSNDELILQMAEHPAGVYEGAVRIFAGGPYAASVRYRYTVHPPPGGERPLQATPASIDFTVPSGGRMTQRVTATGPTWTAEPVVAMLHSSAPPGLSLAQVGPGIFDVTFDAAGLPHEVHRGASWLELQAGPNSAGRTLSVPIQWAVDPPFVVAPRPTWVLDASTQPADLVWRTPVATPHGQPWNWAATSDVAWLKVRTPSGTAGSSSLVVELDAALFVSQTGGYGTGRVMLSAVGVDAVPVEILLAPANQNPALEAASPGALVGDGGRLLLRGLALDSQLIARGELRVVGATIVGSRLHGPLDGFPENYLHEVQLAGMTPGQAVTLSVQRPVLTTQLQIPVMALETPPTARFELPFDKRTQPAHSARQRAWTFAGADSVWSLHREAAGWGLTQSQLPGVIDVDPSPDETFVLASTAASRLVRLAPRTLAAISAPIDPGIAATGILGFWPNTEHGRKLISHGADGPVRVVVERYARVGDPRTGMAATYSPLRHAPDAAYGYVRGGFERQAPVHLVVSPDRWFLASQDDAAQSFFWTMTPYGLGWNESTNVFPYPHERVLNAAGVRPTMMTASGTLRQGTAGYGLDALIPGTHRYAGAAVSNDGRRAWVHVVRHESTASGERALDARLLVVDVTSAVPSLLSTVSMSGAVGCLLPRVATQPCDSVASVAPQADGRAVVVLGRQAVEVVPMPAALAAGRDTRAAASASMPDAKGPRVQGPVKVKTQP